MNRLPRIRSELVFNIIVMVLAGYIMLVSVQMGFGTLKEPEAGFFPFLGGVLLFFANLFVLGEKERQADSVFKQSSEIFILLKIALLFVFWIVLMPRLGYVIVTLLTVFGMSKVLKLEGWVKPILLSVIVSFFIYLLFDYWFYLDLPRGILAY
jgi:putative tricarboxylic transport membrane protein